MLETVRTSYTLWPLAEGIDNPSCKGERDRLDELPLVLDENPPVMGRERGHNVLPFQLSADEIGSAVELDRAVTVDLADERHSALGDGKSEATVGIHVGFEREAVREMAENRPGLVAEDSGKPGSMVGEVEASAGLLEVVVTEFDISGAAIYTFRGRPEGKMLTKRLAGPADPKTRFLYFFDQNDDRSAHVEGHDQAAGQNEPACEAGRVRVRLQS
jgi:hypothetical protein